MHAPVIYVQLDTEYENYPTKTPSFGQYTNLETQT